jgi:ADP-ribose pyrophosphatase YjhB (NUDIX family)
MIVVTTFVAFQKSLLWVRRAIEPKRGAWAIPGGYLEQGEELREGAARELREEAGVSVPPGDLSLYMMGTLTFINQIYVGFRASVDSLDCTPGTESLECAFFDRRDCPWDEVAYPEVNESIEQAYADLESGQFSQWHVEMTADSYSRVAINTGALGS